MTKVYISLGSNLGDRLQNLKSAVKIIEESLLRNTSHSIILETDAISFSEDTPPYLNMIISGDTTLSPHELLFALKGIEYDIGRPKEYKKWSSRVIDLDILLYGDLELKTEDLTIPHPEIKNRPFFMHLLSLMGVKNYMPTKEMISFSRSFVLNPSLVGIVNVTNDSFSDGGKFFDSEKAIDQILSLISDGASVVDIGAQSTRPGAVMKDASDEINALEPVLDGIRNIKSEISIDTFRDEVVEWLIHNNYKISWINDVKCTFSDKTLNLIRESGCKICVMHSLSVPPTKEKVLPIESDPMSFILNWGKNIVEKLKKIGFYDENIILDPGIGFGKTSYQNLEILRRTVELKSLGVPIMIGHSRKGYTNAFSNYSADCRDIETIAVSSFIEESVEYIRIHNVRDHMRSLVAKKVLLNK